MLAIFFTEGKHNEASHHDDALLTIE